ncbi:CoA transferase subunit A [Candidatus Thorarchaeota archaeon]|nr:MAG: CoA transferase subunit A [Candidatus Thorarchaeota archaeon]
MDSSNKLISAREAVKQYVHKADCISLGGFTVSRNPMSLVHEVIRQGIANLHLVMHSGGQAHDLLIGAGLIRIVELAYGANGRFASTCVRFRKAVEGSRILVEDYTNYHMTLRFMAGAMGVPFLPTSSAIGSDIVKRWGFSQDMRALEEGLPDKKLVEYYDPFDAKGKPVILVPAVNPDVTLLHVQKAAEEGTISIEGLTFADIEQARASKHVIVSAEEIVSAHEMRETPWRNSLPHTLVDAVVHQPFGAHPTACFGCYDYDAKHLLDYRVLAEDDNSYREYMREHIYEIESFNEYLNLIGKERLDSLRAISQFGYARRC